MYITLHTSAFEKVLIEQERKEVKHKSSGLSPQNDHPSTWTSLFFYGVVGAGKNLYIVGLQVTGVLALCKFHYHKITSSRPVYYSILELLFVFN
jgi:hypothetical protein